MMVSELMHWPSVSEIESQTYECWNCGKPLASNRGWKAVNAGNSSLVSAYICICHHCSCPTFLHRVGGQFPGSLFGREVSGIDDQSVVTLYAEARHVMTVQSYTAAVLCCRKLLMHIAVAKGAPGGGAFTDFVTFLLDKHYVPPDARAWVDHIRTKGNEANHEILIASREEAEELIAFCEMLLKLVFEFPATMRSKVEGRTA